MYNFKKLFKVASTAKTQPLLNLLYIQDGFVFATDAFKAIKMKTSFELHKVGFITKLSAAIAQEKSKEYKAMVLPEVTALDEFPDQDHPAGKFDSIVPAAFAATAVVNRKYHIDLLTSLQKAEGADDVVLRIPAEANKPIMVENSNGKGILMPISQNKD